MQDNERIIYKLLGEVFSKKAYSGISLNDALSEISEAGDRAYITKIFYGVIEKSIQFDYIIATLCQKKPKNDLIIILKIGLYLLRYTAAPDYAAISKTVNLAKGLGKSGASGFINATLRKSTEISLENIKFPTKSKQLSVIYSYPEHLVRLLLAQLGEQQTTSFLGYENKESTHIRHNGQVISKQDFIAKLQQIAAKTGKTYQDSGLGFYVSHQIMAQLPPQLFTTQSYASMLAVRSYTNQQEIKQLGLKKVLDLCSAPGGKAIYLKELYPELDIKCCDIHPHRLKLVQQYADRMGAKLDLELNDATKLRNDYLGQFDLVICDVPCSGLGLVGSKPDIILNRTEADIHALAKLQYDIISNAVCYLKKDGILCYSTCTVLNQENGEIIAKTLKNNPNLKLLPIENGIANSDGALSLLPHINDCDGFYIARLINN